MATNMRERGITSNYYLFLLAMLVIIVIGRCLILLEACHSVTWFLVGKDGNVCVIRSRET